MSLRVLVADDIGTVRAVVRNLLVSLGVDGTFVYEAPNGAEAIKIIESEELDLIVTDWNMPHASGIDVLHAARDRSEELPVVFLTSKNHRDEVLSAVAAGANDYILKPFVRSQLTAKVSYWLNVARTRRDAAGSA